MQYNLKPEIKIKSGKSGYQGYQEITQAIKEKLSSLKKESVILAVECYPGVSLAELRQELFAFLAPHQLIFADDYTLAVEEINHKIKDTLTEDRVFGVLSHYVVEDFYPLEKIQQARKQLEQCSGLTIIFGTGTTVLCDPDMLIYADLTRWEIQCRYRYERMPNWKAENFDEDALRKFKRGYFFEWRMADRQKKRCYTKTDFILDTNKKGKPAMIEGEVYRDALHQAARQPFRLVPYFDASVWGGQWMKEKFKLDPQAENFGWAFDGVPEENSLLLNFQGTKIEIPAINLVFQYPDELLGPKVHSRFGTEFPIRFDYLDTVQGGNLSLQVHPLVEYAQDKFGISYTQDESYYILDATENSTVYLGVRTGADKQELFQELAKAAKGKTVFPAEDYVNIFPVKKHDHVMIPAGTIHCCGPDTVVLEISATPYIFTFKLWDWERTGLDGRPRPVHLEHGKKNVLMSRNTEMADQQLISRYEAESKNISEQENVVTEKTGLYELEFIETHRHWFTETVTIETHDSVNMLNLIEGEKAVVESLDNSFEPFPINFGETFIVPNHVRRYKIRNTSSVHDRPVAVIQAFVRNL